MITEQFFWGMALGIAIGAVAVIVWLIVRPEQEGEEDGDD